MGLKVPCNGMQASSPYPERSMRKQRKKTKKGRIKSGGEGRGGKVRGGGEGGRNIEMII